MVAGKQRARKGSSGACGTCVPCGAYGRASGQSRARHTRRRKLSVAEERAGPFQGGLVRSVVLFRSKIGDKTRAVKAPQSGLSAAGWESCAESALSAGICMGKFLAAVRLWNGPSDFLTMAAQLRAVRSEPLLRGGSPGRWMNARGQGAAFVSIAATSMPIAATPGDDPCRRAAKLTRAGNCSHGCLNTTLAVNGRPASAKNARLADLPFSAGGVPPRWRRIARAPGMPRGLPANSACALCGQSPSLLECHPDGGV